MPRPKKSANTVESTIAPITSDTIGELLDAYRARYSITSDDRLGAALGVSGQAIYRWRKGQVDRSAKVLVAIVLHLSCNQDHSLQSTPA